MPVGQGLGMSVPESTSPSITPGLTPAASARLDFTQISPLEAASITRARAGVMRSGGAPIEADAVARRGRNEGAARAHHHAQHHAGRGERVIGDPVGEVEPDARQRRHVVDHFDDGAELLALDLGRLPRPRAAATPRRDIPQARAARRRTAPARPAFPWARDSRKAPAARAAA